MSCLAVQHQARARPSTNHLILFSNIFSLGSDAFGRRKCSRRDAALLCSALSWYSECGSWGCVRGCLSSDCRVQEYMKIMEQKVLGEGRVSALYMRAKGEGNTCVTFTRHAVAMSYAASYTRPRNLKLGVRSAARQGISSSEQEPASGAPVTSRSKV
jgi:hypothetical protein